MAGKHEDNIFLIGDVDDALEDIILPLAKAIEEEASKKEGRIDLYVNSYGGYSHIAMHIVDLMESAKRQNVIVRTVVPAFAFSAGSFIAVAGSPGERYINRSGEHLVHYGIVGSQETTPTQAERYRGFKDRTFKSVVNHYKKYCHIPNLEEQIADDGFFLKAADCIKYGLADKYTEKFKA